MSGALTLDTSSTCQASSHATPPPPLSATSSIWNLPAQSTVSLTSLAWPDNSLSVSHAQNHASPSFTDVKMARDLQEVSTRENELYWSRRGSLDSNNLFMGPASRSKLGAIGEGRNSAGKNSSPDELNHRFSKQQSMSHDRPIFRRSSGLSLNLSALNGTHTSPASPMTRTNVFYTPSLSSSSTSPISPSPQTPSGPSIPFGRVQHNGYLADSSHLSASPIAPFPHHRPSRPTSPSPDPLLKTQISHNGPLPSLRLRTLPNATVSADYNSPQHPDLRIADHHQLNWLEGAEMLGSPLSIRTSMSGQGTINPPGVRLASSSHHTGVIDENDWTLPQASDFSSLPLNAFDSSSYTDPTVHSGLRMNSMDSRQVLLPLMQGSPSNRSPIVHARFAPESIMPHGSYGVMSSHPPLLPPVQNSPEHRFVPLPDSPDSPFHAYHMNTRSHPSTHARLPPTQSPMNTSGFQPPQPHTTTPSLPAWPHDAAQANFAYASHSYQPDLPRDYTQHEQYTPKNVEYYQNQSTLIASSPTDAHQQQHCPPRSTSLAVNSSDCYSSPEYRPSTNADLSQSVSPTSTTVSISSEGSRSFQHEPINFLHLLHPSSSPPYELFVARIVNNSDQQASVFLQQKLKAANAEARSKIVQAIVERGFDMMTHRFGNWAVQRCLESPCTREDRAKLVAVMRHRIVELATNCYGTHVIQKALDCEEDIKLLILSELLIGDPYSTLMNKHAAHVWSRIMELTWAEPAPPIFKCVNVALKGRWADLACHETGSLVVQHAFENLEEEDTKDLVGEIFGGFDRVVRDSWGSWVIQHILEHGAEEDRSRTVKLLLDSLYMYGSDAQAIKSIEKALKTGDAEVLEMLVTRMCEPGVNRRRAVIVDLALNSVGGQLIATILPGVDKAQGTQLYDAIKKHVVTLKGSKSGSRVTWLFDKMRAYFGY